jgi:DNA polymerase-4
MKRMLRKRIILHIDMNSYFASVEQQANPFLRGRSVGVCAYLSPRGCIIASSREAKAKGIKTGTRVAEAKLLDPDIVLIENEPAKYRSITERVFAILGEYSDTVEPYSIDEAFIDLSGWALDYEAALLVARTIQARIKQEVGEWLGASVGISWTKFLAKFASDLAPKQGVLLIENDSELEALINGRGLCEAWGINKRLEARLLDLGINDLLDLRRSDPSNLRRAFGLSGYYLWANLNGVEISQVHSGLPESKSIGHSYCLPKATQDKAYLARIFSKLCEKTGRRLRRSSQEAGAISIYLAYSHSGGLGRSFRTADRLFSSEEILAPVSDFLERSFLVFPVRMLAVSVFRLSPVSSQLSLFDDNLKKKDLVRALDKINDKYGEYTLVRGQLFGLESAAKDRIGFRKL